MGIGKIERNTVQRVVGLGIFREFMTSVRRNAANLFSGNFAEHTNHAVSDRFRGSVRSLNGQQKAFFSVHHRGKPRAALLADDRIALPMSRLKPLLHGLRTLGNAVFYHVFPLFVDTSVLFAPFSFPSQMERIAVAFVDISRFFLIYQATVQGEIDRSVTEDNIGLRPQFFLRRS